MARTALEEFGLRKIVFLPCSQSPLKKNRPVAKDGDRLAMLRAGLRGHGWADVSDWEIRQGGVSYTVDTVNAMAQRFPGKSMAWIMGSDQWKLLSAWKNPRELARQLFFLVFPRSAPPRPRRGFRMKEISLRIDISATEIRERMRKKLSIEGLVLPSVERVIRHRGLYR